MIPYDYNLLGTHFGCVFAANAVSPIFVFSEVISFSPHLSAVTCTARSTLAVSHASRNPCLVTKIASGEIATICCASSTASAKRVSCDFEILLTSPYDLASCADNRRPVSAISDAICKPQVRIMRGRPPAAA